MRIYLDHNATTPLHPLSADRMAQAMREVWGNASSVHHFGQQAKAALDEARGSVAALLGADPAEVVFTAGGTESDNLAIRGAADALEPAGRKHLITTAIEHEAVLNTMKSLARRGWRVTTLPVDATGIVSPDRLREAITDDTALVSVMHANNEIGTIQPVAELAAIAHEHGALVHTDAVQTAGKLPLNVRTLGVDLLTIAGHKFYGPKGTGALWVRRGVRLVSPLTGGRQERNRRAGTENVPALVGLGVAAEAAGRTLGAEGERLAALRDRLEAGILSTIAGSARNGAAGAAGAEHVEHQHRSHRVRVGADRPRPGRHRRLVRLGVFVRHARTVARAQGDGPPPPPHAGIDPLQSWRIEYRGRHRSRPRSVAAAGGETAKPNDRGR